MENLDILLDNAIAKNNSQRKQTQNTRSIEEKDQVLHRATKNPRGKIGTVALAIKSLPKNIKNTLNQVLPTTRVQVLVLPAKAHRVLRATTARRERSPGGKKTKEKRAGVSRRLRDDLRVHQVNDPLSIMLLVCIVLYLIYIYCMMFYDEMKIIGSIYHLMLGCDSDFYAVVAIFTHENSFEKLNFILPSPLFAKSADTSALC